MLRFQWLLIAALAWSCAPKNKFDNPDVVRIFEWQDHRNDSVAVYFTHNNPSLRAQAALAAASMQSEALVPGLVKLLTDEDSTVVASAAFALGQLGDKAKAQTIVSALKTTEPSVANVTLEAFGKTVQAGERHEPLTTAGKSTELQSGVAWALYRLGTRALADSTDIQLAASLLKSADPNARLGAAHFFQRATYKISTPPQEWVDALSDTNPEVVMALTRGLGKFDDRVLPLIANAARHPDYRVRVNACVALRSKSWANVKELTGTLLKDSNTHVVVAASEFVAGATPVVDSSWVADAARASTHWRAQANLFGCALKLHPSKSVGSEVKTMFQHSASVYQQAALLSALASDADNYSFIFEQFKNGKAPVILSTAANALATINRSPAFRPTWKDEFWGMYRWIIEQGDAGSISAVCSVLADSTLGYRSISPDVSFLETAKAKLSLPRDFETYVPLTEALNHLKGLPPPTPLKNDFNHPIDWKLATTLANDQTVTIETTKGKIVMALLIDEAPGSVVNFVKLVNEHYFDGRYFHRVVPNFVIQTGCHRGDGFGSEDYSIRSEFTTRKYKTGSVGMASAGKDTEGTQWFITHSPTPHLDGRYTIFAEVISGMEVVHAIEIGDQIISARLTGY